MNFVGPCVFAEIKPPPVPLLAISPWLAKLDPFIAIVLPSNLTFFEYFFGELPLFPMFGKGDGTKGAGGPGILHTLGILAFEMLLHPLVTGVLGGLMVTVPIDILRSYSRERVQPADLLRSLRRAKLEGRARSLFAIRPLQAPRKAGLMRHLHRPRLPW